MKEFLTKIQLLLLALVGLTPDGKQKFRDETHYIRQSIAGGGIINLITGADLIKKGVNTFNNNRIKQGTAMLVDRIEIEVALQQAAGTTASKAIYKPVDDTIADSAVANAEIEVLIDDRQVFFGTLSQFRQAKVNCPNGVQNGFNLDAPKLVKDTNKIDINFITPDGSTIYTGSGSDKLNFIAAKLCGQAYSPAIA